MHPATVTHLRRAWRIFPGTLLAWWVAVIVATRITALRTGPVDVYIFVGSGIIATVIASAMVLLETRPPQRRPVRYWPGRDLAARALLYGLLASLMVWLLWWLLPMLVPGVEPMRHGRPFTEVITDARIQRFIVALVIASCMLNFFLHLRFVLGPKHLRALFTGKYRDPVFQERCFVFIDLIDSTSIAQRLGPMQFTHFKHDFFSDLTGPVIESGGQIIQYVGDEVMLSWDSQEVTERGGPILFVEAAKAQLAQRAAYYEKRYGEQPRFRTGIHAGTIVAAQVGDIRRDIVFSGDVVNTAARLLQACRPQGCELLISEEAVALLPVALRQNLVSHEALQLRGRAHPMPTFRLAAQAPARLAAASAE